MADLKPVMDVDELNLFLRQEFPQLEKEFQIIRIDEGSCQLNLQTSDKHLRPGGTVSGPTLFTLADVAAYGAILAHIGPVALAVTTNLNINFLRKAEPGTLEATASILKLGKRLAVLEISIICAKKRDLIAHATTTYSIPPR